MTSKPYAFSANASHTSVLDTGEALFLPHFDAHEATVEVQRSRLNMIKEVMESWQV
jgi:hypothetical protein